MQKVLTIHVQKAERGKGTGNGGNPLRLTTEIAEILSVLAVQLEAPTLRVTNDGIGVFKNDYSGTI